MTTILNHAKMTVTGSPGTGTFTLGGAYSDGTTFAAAGVTNGMQIIYAAYNGLNFEQGQGTYSSTGPTLTRNTVAISSSNNGKVSFGSGTYVYAVAVADTPITTPTYAVLTTGLPFDPNTNGQRITGNLSGSTVANRLLFQTALANGDSHVGVIPNGTSNRAVFSAESDPLVVNGWAAQLSIQGVLGEARVESLSRGTAGAGFITFYTGGAERARINNTGTQASLLLSGGSDVGFFATAGGITNRLAANSSVGYGFIGTDTGHDLVIRTNATERMRVTSAGKVRIGAGGISTYTLNINNGTDKNVTFRAASDFSPNTWDGTAIQGVNTGDNAWKPIYLEASILGLNTIFKQSIVAGAAITSNAQNAIYQTLGNVDVTSQAWPWRVTRSGADVYQFVGNDQIGWYDSTRGYLLFLDIANNNAQLAAGRLIFPGSAQTYGAVTIRGDKNSWPGINFETAGGTNLGYLLINSNTSGFYNGSAWDWQWTSGVLTAGSVPASRITGLNVNAVSGDLSVSGNLSAAAATFTGTVSANAHTGVSATLSGAFQSASATVTGALSANSATITGTLSANALSSTTSITAASGTISGTLGANALTSTTSIAAASASISGLMAANSITSTTTIAAASMSTTGNIAAGAVLSGASASITGALSAGSASISGAVSVGSISAPNIAKAWVRFAGDGTILRSSGVSSVTRNSTGNYTVNFSSAFANTQYGLALSADWAGSTNYTNGPTIMVLAATSGDPKTTSSVNVVTQTAGGSFGGPEDCGGTLIAYY